jgi:hypothetical protein
MATGSRFSTGWITKRWVELKFNPPYTTAVYSVLLEKHKYFVLQLKDSRFPPVEEKVYRTVVFRRNDNGGRRLDPDLHREG